MSSKCRYGAIFPKTWMLFYSHAVSADATVLIRSYSRYASTVKMAKCGWKLPSRGLYWVTNIQLINGCSYIQLMLVIESYSGPSKRLVKTNHYFRAVKKFRSYSQAVNKRSRLACLLNRVWFYCTWRLTAHNFASNIGFWWLEILLSLSTTPEIPTDLADICWAPQVILVQLSEEARPLSVSQSVQTGCRDHPASRRYTRVCVCRGRGRRCFPGGKAAHSPLPSAEVKNEWSYTVTSPYVFMSCRGTALPCWMHTLRLYLTAFWHHFHQYVYQCMG
jgi:hypothetical protein